MANAPIFTSIPDDGFKLYGKVAPAGAPCCLARNLRRIGSRARPTGLTAAKAITGARSNLSGDYLRAAAGLTTMDYMETSLAVQLPNFYRPGMLRRKWQSAALRPFLPPLPGRHDEPGYWGKSFERCRDLVWRGAWTSLFMLSPTGQAPPATAPAIISGTRPMRR